jgi:hypothetical protein
MGIRLLRRLMGSLPLPAMAGRLPRKWAKRDLVFKNGSELTFTLKQEFNSGQHALGRFRLAVTDAPRPVSFGISPETSAILAVALDKRTPQQKKKLSDTFKNTDPDRIKLTKALEQARKPLPEDPKLKQFQDKLSLARTPVPLPPRIARLRRDLELSKGQLVKKRIVGAQDLAWAIINTPAFLFNR